MGGNTTHFKTVLPHEPLPSHPRGYIHLQGAFVPKKKEVNGAQSLHRPLCPEEKVLAEEEQTKSCKCADVEYIQTTLTSNLSSLIQLCGMDLCDLLSVEPIIQETNKGDNNVGKVRLELSTPAAARRLCCRIRRGNYGPRDLLASTIITDGNDESAAGITVQNEGVCPFGCKGRYVGKAVMATEITPTIDVQQQHLEDDEEDSIRWERAAPPKFRRLLANSNSQKFKLTEEEIEERRDKTRFVYLDNVLGNELTLDDITLEGQSIETSMKNDLMSIFQGGSLDNPTGVIKNGLLQQDARIEDDLRHAFQEALRDKLSQYDSSENSLGIELFIKADTAAGKKSKPDNIKKEDPNDTVATRLPFDHLHIGMRSNDDATKLIQCLQGKRLHLEMELPNAFLQNSAATNITIITGKLYLDYADVLQPKKGNLRNKKNEVKIHKEPSKSECTSSTDHVHIAGLHVIPNFVSVQEEQMLMAGLTGPHAPWAPPQLTQTGGHIKRRVQHYGYVFDYESSDVLRRDDGGPNDTDGRGSDKSACPPLPSMGSNVAEMTDDEVEEWTERAVQDVKVWEALAGVIEKTRRFDVSSVVSKGDLNDRVSNISLGAGTKQTYPHLNQLTINEYNPGEGIGSHVDTVTAFDDSLLIITLNGGIVMEFRKAVDDGIESNMRKLVYLPPRSLAVLSGDARYKYEHMIVSRMTDTVNGEIIPRQLRVSLTLRTALTAPVFDEGVEKISLARSKVPQSHLPKYESKVFPPRWGQLSDAALANASNKIGGEKHSSVDRSELITPETESKHVHAVYDAIATQWHHTRGKRGVLWPGATQFIESLPPGSIVADVGCGDGKYFAEIIKHSYVIGTDISEPLLKTAATRGDEVDDGKKKNIDGPQYQRLSKTKRALTENPAVAVADCLHIPLRSKSCDAAISIAVMHHLSTEARRIRCLAELKRIVKVGGRFNVQAWALEQENDSKRKFHGTDLLVPFNAQPKYLQTQAKPGENNDKIQQPKSLSSSESKGKGVAQMMAEQYDGAEFDSKKNLVVFQRYCHMYRKGELESLCERVPGLEVLESAYEKGNWVITCRVCE
jgi:SAM-dependent methyltransferase/alkylated DNA repair dioxygenase AlkB